MEGQRLAKDNIRKIVIARVKATLYLDQSNMMDFVLVFDVKCAPILGNTCNVLFRNEHQTATLYLPYNMAFSQFHNCHIHRQKITLLIGCKPLSITYVKDGGGATRTLLRVLPALSTFDNVTMKPITILHICFGNDLPPL